MGEIIYGIARTKKVLQCTQPEDGNNFNAEIINEEKIQWFCGTLFGISLIHCSQSMHI